MSLEVALGGEGAAADAALEGPLARVRAVVHLQGRLAAQDAPADDALVGVSHLVLQVVHQRLQLRNDSVMLFCPPIALPVFWITYLGRLAVLRDLDQRLPSVVVASGPDKIRSESLT